MANSTLDSYQLYLALRRSEQEGFCARYGYNYQSGNAGSTGGGSCYHTANNVANFVTSSSSRTSSSGGSSHTSKNCSYRSLFG